MQANELAPEVINRLNAYAQGIPPSPPVRYALLHPDVHVPLGCLPIQITQFAHGDPFTDRPLHWSIYISTLPIPGVGHHYELAGDSPVHYIQRTFDDYNVRRGLERGSHTIGYVLPVMLPFLDAHLARTPVRHLRGHWSSQHWVWHALQGLDHPHMYAVNMALDFLVTQMAVVLTAWELANA